MAFAVEPLLSAARAQTGLDGFGDPSFRDGLQILTQALAAAPLTDVGAAACEGQIAGYLRTLEAKHLTVEHPARHRRAVGLALWHVAKAGEVRDRAQRLLAEYAAAIPATSRVPLSTWLSERLLRGAPRNPESA